MVYDFFEELKEIIKEKIKDIYKKSKYFILVFTFLLFIACIFFCEKIDPYDSSIIECQQLKLFGITIDNWAQWITLIAFPYTAGWAFFQFKKSYYAKKQEKAVQIAREFSKSLISECGLIYAVFTNSPLNDYLKLDEKNFDDFKFFNVDELRKIYKDDNFPSEYEKKISELNAELDKIYHFILLNNVTSYKNEKILKVNLDLKKKSIESVEEIQSHIDTEANPFILQNQNMPYHFYELVSNVLNQLEYICMDISSQATDSNFIYQSLHQMFLRTIRTLAVEISISNKNFSDKYYTNIIHVYNDWTARYTKDLKIEKKKKEKINKILNPKIKTV